MHGGQGMAAGAVMQIPARWRLGITLAVLADAVLAILVLHDEMQHSFQVEPQVFSFGAMPWCLLAVLWLIGWTWRGFAKKKPGV
jgi:hypothetical protein